MDTSAVINTVLLVLIIPAIAALWRTLGKSTESLGRLNDSFNRFASAIVGVEGRGGALEELASLRKRTHKLENMMTALLVGSKIKLPNFNGEIDHDD
jgi:hypothetical protein